MEMAKSSHQLQHNGCECPTDIERKCVSCIADCSPSMASLNLTDAIVKRNILDRNSDKNFLGARTDKLLNKTNEKTTVQNGTNCNSYEDRKNSKMRTYENMRRTELQDKEKNKHDQQSKKKRYLQVRNIEKPQLLFKDVIDNTPIPFIPHLAEKPNALVPLSINLVTSPDGVDEHYCNPYEYEITHFSIPESQLTRVVPVIPPTLENTLFVYVDDEEKLMKMINQLGFEKEMAIDLENHSYRSFQGFSCLIQISTRCQDYVVDGITLRDKLWHLNKAFTDPNMVKVFHGAELDILWLQRDFGVYVVNMFDTRQACITLDFEHLSLAHLLQTYCSIEAKKKYQLYDWRVRPLPDDVLKYARIDTHYLLYIYDVLRNALLDAGNEKPDLLKLMYEKSSAICSQPYEKDVITEDSYLKVYKLTRKNFDNRQLLALKKLYDWRDNLARKEDESPGYILPNQMLLSIADALCYQPIDIIECCKSMSKLARKHLNDIQEIVLHARSQPFIKDVQINRVKLKQKNKIADDNQNKLPGKTTTVIDTVVSNDTTVKK